MLKEMNVQELIDALMKIKDKSRPVELRGSDCLFLPVTSVNDISDNVIGILSGDVEITPENAIEQLQKLSSCWNSSQIPSGIIIKNGCKDTDGNPMVDIEFQGCSGNLYGTGFTENEINMFVQGIQAERERIWDRLEDLKNKSVSEIKFEDLYKKGE